MTIRQLRGWLQYKFYSCISIGPLIHKDYPVVKTFKAGLTVRLFPRLFGVEGAENVLAAVNSVAVEVICSDAFDDKA